MIGSGASGSLCVDTLIRSGHGKNIKILTADSYPPYDRTKLSKMPGEEAEKLLLRNNEYYKQNSVELVVNQIVTRIDFNKKQIYCESGNTYNYDKLVIATGSLANEASHNITGHKLNGIFTLRTVLDANRLDKYFRDIKNSSNHTNKKISVVIVGGGFIGMELASYFTGKADTVTVLTRSVPFEAHFGKDIGNVVKNLHEKKGVQLRIKNFEIDQFIADEKDINKLSGIKLKDNTILTADLCIMAIGGRPMTDFLKDSSIKMTDKGLINVNEFMETNIPDVYATGDITSFPRKCLAGFEQINKNTKTNEINIAHWGFAMLQGRCAAESILKSINDVNRIEGCGLNTENGFRILPFFWSANHGQSIRYAGFSQEYDDVIFHPDPSGKNEFKCVSFFLLKNQVVGVCSIGWDPVCAQFAEAMHNNIGIFKNDIETNQFDLKRILSENSITDQMTKL